MQDLFDWLTTQGGFIHPSLAVINDPIYAGSSIYTSSSLHPGTEIVRTPYEAVITRRVAERAVRLLIRGDAEDTGREEEEDALGLGMVKEVQWITAYVVLHWVFGGDDLQRSLPAPLHHRPYILTLPSLSDLPTSPTFTPAELALVRGTNLYHATLDRVDELRAEWERTRDGVCVSALRECRDGFSWERYLLASTYLSSRAFSSDLVEPSRSSSSSSAPPTGSSPYPVLIPGMDAFNHHPAAAGVYRVEELAMVPGYAEVVVEARGEGKRDPRIVLKREVGQGEQVFISYGQKSNESFILAYGFVPIPNPHDEVVLRLGGGQEPGGAGNTDLAALLSSHDLDISERHVVPMDGTIPPRLWQSVRVVVGAGGAGGVAGGNDERGDVETEMDTADEVARMLESKIQGIERAVRGWRDGGVDVADGGGIRKGVYEMCGVYLQGQLDILARCHGKVMDKMDELEQRLESLDRA